MMVFYDKAERTYYFFYKDRLALVAVDVFTDPNEQLRKKYQSVNTSSFISNEVFQSRHSVELFKRGSTNTRVYSVSSVMATAGWSSRFLIYIPDVSWKELGSDVNAKIAAEQLSEENSQKDSRRNAQQETNRKVQ
jgi:flagellar motor switch protein FliM